MTAEQTAPAEEAGGNRAAGGCVLAIGLAAGGTIAYVVPESAYFVAGLLATRAIDKARPFAARFKRPAEQPAVPPVDIVAALQGLAEGGQNVRLTQLAERTGLPDTKAVRAHLAAVGIPIRVGVRAAGKNGPGVHNDDVPPLLDSDRDTPSDSCLCSSGANTNANNGRPEGAGEGLCVEPIGQSGTVVRVPAERRAYTVTKEARHG